MARKQNCLDLNTKLEIMCLCEFSSTPKNRIGRGVDRFFLTLLMILKSKEKIQSAVLCDVRQANQKLMWNMENEDLGTCAL
jgi:hypothetical protein